MTITEAGSDTQHLDLDTADVKLRNSEILTKLDQEFAHLPADEQVELKQFIGDYPTLFPDVPSVTNTLIQDVDVQGASPIKKPAYRMNPQKREYLRKEIQWTQESMDAFQLLKTMLCSSPVLAAPNFDKPFKLAVDASAVGSGAVLFQEDDQGFDHPVSFASKKFNRHQCNYSTVEKEALGLIQALKHFEIYLKMALHQVMVYTDHNPLTFIHRMKETNQRVLRWSLMLQEYPISIQHIAGKHNVVADTLSRQ
jgi:hypothetical protein